MPAIAVVHCCYVIPCCYVGFVLLVKCCATAENCMHVVLLLVERETIMLNSAQKQQDTHPRVGGQGHRVRDSSGHLAV
jgi:hypothetical protein